MTRHIVAWYELDRAYGGPEEGGWWYDTCTLARIMRVCRSEAQAIALASRANRLMGRLQCGKRSIESVLYDGGRFRACVFEKVPPAALPEIRPHYC